MGLQKLLTSHLNVFCISGVHNQREREENINSELKVPKNHCCFSKVKVWVQFSAWVVLGENLTPPGSYSKNVTNSIPNAFKYGIFPCTLSLMKGCPCHTTFPAKLYFLSLSSRWLPSSCVKIQQLSPTRHHRFKQMALLNE